MGDEVIHCKDCKFWDLDEGIPGTGDCRRFPPASTDAGAIGVWPETLAFDWCGEGVAK